MFVAASTRCFADVAFDVACDQISDLDYDKVELWLSDGSDHLDTAETASDPEHFAAHFVQIPLLMHHLRDANLLDEKPG